MTQAAPRPGGKGRAFLLRWVRGRGGNATVEFVVLFPMMFTLICVMLDMSLMMSRYVLVERAVDQVVRELRLGQMPQITAANVRLALQNRLCADLEIVSTCSTSTTVELTPISRTTFALPATGLPCVQKSSGGQYLVPVTQFVPGQMNELMLLRVCVKVRTMSSASVLSLPATVVAKDGTYAISIAAFFVVEPK